MSLFGSEVIFWFAVGFVFLVLEILTPGIVFVFFGLGAWLVMALRFFFPLWPSFQFVIFILSSVIFLVLLRRQFKLLFNRAKSQGRVDSLSESIVAENYLGREVEVLKDIAPDRPGLVELNGTNWTARAEESLTAGQIVRVVEVSGLTLIVEKLKP
ncbi:MAG: NfeD family protein [Deltaproteobacteria bacterium]|jgi:membrane protein implicated in regulation of membrane protease activity|nr:NfeD family protein [Deltaproteobacteria bacterium]